jgi:redox-sensitive bicupin YhaK (pirin superfamily)
MDRPTERTVTRVGDVEALPGDSQTLRKNLVLVPGDFEFSDPFLLMAEDWFRAPGGFEEHPHRGFETVTVVLEGKVEHRDNHGGHGVLGPGDVQWMTAGRGVLHSELPQGASTVHSLQLWLNLPASSKMAEPSYQDLRGRSMPVRREKGALVRVFSGESGGIRGPARNQVPVTMVELRIEPGASLVQELPASANCFIYLLEGSAAIGAAWTEPREGQVVWLRPEGAGRTQVTLAASALLHAYLWAADPIGEPVVARGPFVMNSIAEVQQAFNDYRTGRF